MDNKEKDFNNFYPELYYFRVTSRKMWDKLIEFFSQEDIKLTPCVEKVYFYEVDVNEQKR